MIWLVALLAQPIGAGGNGLGIAGARTGRCFATIGIAPRLISQLPQ